MLLRKFFELLILLGGLAFFGEGKAYVLTPEIHKGAFIPQWPISFSQPLTSTNTHPEDYVLYHAMSEAINIWNQSLSTNLFVFHSPLYSESPNVIATPFIIRWSYNFSNETHFDANITLALTVRYQTGPVINKIEIILNASRRELLDDEDGILGKVLIHELGHVIGLDHNIDPSTIMYAHPTYLAELSSDDIDGAKSSIGKMSTNMKLYSKSMAKENNSFSCASIDMKERNGPSKGNRSGPGTLLGFLFCLAIIRMTGKCRFKLNYR